MTATTEKVELTNVGPIEGTFAIELSGPGLYELRGSKGAGKSTVLESLSLVAGHKSKLTVHDGELRGQVEAFGVSAPIGSRKKRTGELEVDALDSERFDLVDLIDPQGKTAPVRDANRIKALAILKGVRMKRSDFDFLEDEEFEELGVESTDDPVLFCSRVKRALDADAKRLETQASSLRGRVEQIEESLEGIDLTQECDPAALLKSIQETTGELSRLQEARVRCESDKKAREEAKRKLEEIEAEHEGESVEEIDAEIDAKSKEVDENLAMIEELEAKLAAAKAQREEQVREVRALQERREAAISHEKAVAALKAVLDGDAELPPTDEQIDAAKQSVLDAEASHEEGVRIRDAKKRAAEAETMRGELQDLDKRSERIRAAGRRVFDALTAKLDTKEILIEDVDGSARLIVRHPKRGKTFFDQIDGLSDGERVRTSIEELLPFLKSPGLFPVPQRTYQDLPPADRRELAAVAAEKGIYIFGAQVSDGELRFEKVH